tara:strand:- start:246 stop:449 length:204 start_codon:yes stop_codon:yes gene_type:complete
LSVIIGDKIGRGYVLPKSKSKLIKQYRGMSRADAIKKAAYEYSDNGRCWWIFQIIKDGYHAKYTIKK